MCEPLQNPPKHPTHSISHTLRHAQTAAGSCRVTLIPPTPPPHPVQMKCLSSEILFEKDIYTSSKMQSFLEMVAFGV